MTAGNWAIIVLLIMGGNFAMLLELMSEKRLRLGNEAKAEREIADLNARLARIESQSISK